MVDILSDTLDDQVKMATGKQAYDINLPILTRITALSCRFAFVMPLWAPV